MNIELLAKSGEPMPQGLTSAEQMFFQSVAYLTSRYLSGNISAEQARYEMVEIRRAYKHNIEMEKYIKHCADLWLNIETASREFAKERTIESAVKMYETIYNIKLGAERIERN